jgi:hypothetical protein
MRKELEAIAKQLLGRNSNLDSDKEALIDFAFDRFDVVSFADLGGVWNVDGGYSFHAMQHRTVKAGTLVDTDFTPAVMARQRKYPALKLLEGNFGDPSMPAKIGKVDAVFFFDTLLHQVNPDWDDVLRMYAPIARIVIIFNQQYVNLSKTTRLLDLGLEQYAHNVPHPIEKEPYKTYFQDLNAIHPQHGRPYRDIHNIWQWGIVDDDLFVLMRILGYRAQLYKNCGQFGSLKGVENHGFVFLRSEI